MTKKKTGGGKSGARKLKLKKDTIRDLSPKRRNVKGGALVLEKYTDDYACTAVTCFTHCDQVTCATPGCPLDTLQCVRR